MLARLLTAHSRSDGHVLPSTTTVLVSLHLQCTCISKDIHVDYLLPKQLNSTRHTGFCCLLPMFAQTGHVSHCWQVGPLTRWLVSVAGLFLPTTCLATSCQPYSWCREMVRPLKEHDMVHKKRSRPLRRSPIQLSYSTLIPSTARKLRNCLPLTAYEITHVFVAELLVVLFLQNSTACT